MAELIKRAPVDTPNRTRRMLGSVGSAVYRPVARAYGPLQRLFNRVLTGSSSVYDIPSMALLVAAPVMAAMGFFDRDMFASSTLETSDILLLANASAIIGWALAAPSEYLVRSEQYVSPFLQTQEGSPND